jgi:rod shape-determining protein MreB and related proteins
MSNFIEKLRKIHLPFLSSMHVYFDLGTSTTRIAIKEKGVVMREPTYLGYNSRIKEFIFFGSEAKTIVGKTPDFIKINRPIVNGILYDFDAEVSYLLYGMYKSVHPYLSQYSLLKPPITAFGCVPTIATEIEQKAVDEALQKAECSDVILIEKSLATAAGCGFNIFSHQPHFIIDMGGGLIELSIISGGGIVAQKTLKNAGDHMNKLIGNYVYMKHGVILGELTCENLKIDLLNFSGDEKTATVRGKSLETGLPKSIKLKSSDIREALISQFNQIVDAAKELIEISPPEVADEVFQNGIALTGNLAGVKGVDRFFVEELKIETFIVEHYADATIYGLMKLGKKPEDIYKLVGNR